MGQREGDEHLFGETQGSSTDETMSYESKGARIPKTPGWVRCKCRQRWGNRNRQISGHRWLTNDEALSQSTA